MNFDSFQLAQDKFLKQEDRVIRDYGFGATKDAMSIIQAHINRATEIVSLKIQETSRSSMKEICNGISILPPERVALVALQVGIDCIAGIEDLNRTMHILGHALKVEIEAQRLADTLPKAGAQIDQRIRKRASSLKARRTGAKVLAGRKGFEFQAWDDETSSRAGMWLVEVLLQLDDVFVMVPYDEDMGVLSPYLTLTDEALAYSQEFVRTLLEAHPIPLPQLTMPPAWTGLELPLETNGRTYKVPMVRKAFRGSQAPYLKQALKDGRLQPVMDALTRASQVAWSINAPIVDLVKWAYANNVEVEGLPSQNNVPLPDRLADDVWAAMNEDQQRAYRRELGGKIAKNRALIGEREVLKADLAIADILLERGNTFYTPMNLDYRGRMYGSCYYNFQRQDYVRGTFLFKEGKPLGPDGLYWLKVHAANCGDFPTANGKASKAPFADRVAWVDENLPRLLEMAKDPTQDLWWTEADAPFLFVAAVMDIAAAINSGNPETYVSHIPVSFDGSCSGLQHFAAMTRCDVTADLVSLTQRPMPADVYQTVADAVKVKIDGIAEVEGEFQAVARKALEYGITRSLVKRNVMTWAYSSQKFGMTQQLVEDTMLPLKHKVALGKLAAHPFAIPGEKFDGQLAAKLLGGVTYDTIEEVVQRPAEAMEFLRKIARALAHEGKPVVWHTPLGFPVVLHYPNLKTNRVHLWMMDRGVRVQVRCANVEEAPGIDKNRAANAVAPGFVHSYDACHLQMVINEAYSRGIPDVALVHDSFGCHAGVASEFRSCITDTFHRLYSENDVLADILQESCAQISSNYHRLPLRTDVTTGTYDLNDIKGALYAFA